MWGRGNISNTMTFRKKWKKGKTQQLYSHIYMQTIPQTMQNCSQNTTQKLSSHRNGIQLSQKQWRPTKTTWRRPYHTPPLPSPQYPTLQIQPQS